MPSALFRPGILDGQVAIVSGGGSGLGRATALELAACGATVFVCGRRSEPLEETAELADGARCVPLVCDVRDEVAVDACVEHVLQRMGRVDLLVNNAGGQYLAPAEEITAKGFRAVLDLNVGGTWLMTHAVATRAMIPSGAGGKVVNITLSPHSGLPGMAHSSAARAAVENLTRVLAIEWARFGIKVNAIAAGQFATETFMTKYPRQMIETAADTVPLGRLGRPEEIAWHVAHLASPAGDYVSGAVLTIDGGRDNWCGSWPPDTAVESDGTPLREIRRRSRT